MAAEAVQVVFPANKVAVSRGDLSSGLPRDTWPRKLPTIVLESTDGNRQKKRKE